MRVVHGVALILLISLFGSLSGCSSETSGTPSSPGAAQSTSPAPEGLPQVAEPLKVAPFEKRPCALVEEDMIATIGDLGAGKSDVKSEDAKRLTGPSCNWSSEKSVLSVRVIIDTVHRDHGMGGIKSVYDGKEQGLIEYVEEVKVPGHPGYPAAFADASDKRSDGEYPLSVGVTDNLLINVLVTNWDNPQQARSAALKVAASVLDTLKKGS